jgi:[ribosomal protein S5]-alanine N-acetyltransferase
MRILETDRLLFRDHEPRDLEPFCEMESNPEFRWPQPVHSRIELERSFREAWLTPKAMGLAATIYKPDGRYIGRCGLYPARDGNGQEISGEAMLACYIARPYWGRGFATEAGRAFVDYGFETLKLNRIEAGMNAQNLASIRVAEKLGFSWCRSGEGGGSHWHLYEMRNPAMTVAVPVS